MGAFTCIYSIILVISVKIVIFSRTGGEFMAKIKITCDSTADLSPEMYEELDITRVPLYIILDEETYRDSIDIQPDDIFAFVDTTGRLPKTAACSSQGRTDTLSNVADAYAACIHFHLGAQLSSSHQNARIAAQNCDNVYVVTPGNLSTGTGQRILGAKRMADEGMSAEEIVRQST